MKSQHRDNKKPKFNEWYTPDYVFHVIVELLEEEFPVLVDMYSSEEANKNINAEYIFTKENPWDNDAAISMWGGSRVNGWCNPPYLGHDWPNQAVKNIIECMKYNVFGNLFLIMNANMETAYSQLAMNNAQYMFLFNKRLSFIDARTGKKQDNNNKGQALYYFGDKKLSSQFTNDDGVLVKLKERKS